MLIMLRTTAAAAVLVAFAGSAMAAETVVTLDNGVVGTLSAPDSGATGPAVVMLHGFASSRNEVGDLFVRQAAALSAAGITSLRIDFRGFGDSAGDAADMTIESMLEDSAAARAYLAGVDGVDPARIGTVAYSFGAAVAMLDQANYESIVAWGQMGDLKGEFLAFLGQESFDKAAADGQVDLDLGWRKLSLKAPFFESVSRHSLADGFAGFDGEFLTIAGENDPATGYFEQYLALAAGKKDSLVIPRADHMLGSLTDEPALGDQAIAATTEFVAANL